jgi:hypothetical protein
MVKPDKKKKQLNSKPRGTWAFQLPILIGQRVVKSSKWKF